MSAQEAQVQSPQRFIDLSDYQFSGDNATVERKCGFITAYLEHGSIFHAAQVCRVNRKTVYRWMEADPQFAEAVADCKEDCYDQVETSVFKKAVNGGTLESFFYLKAHRPKYRDKVSVDVTLVQDEIDSMMSRLDSVSRQQLPAAMTEFIGTEFNQSTQEYQPLSQPIHDASDSDQKEELPLPANE